MAAVSLSYTFTVADILAARAFAKNDLSISPQPSPPTLVKAYTSSLELGWTLPQPPGVSQKVEIQYAAVNHLAHSHLNSSKSFRVKSADTTTADDSDSTEIDSKSLTWLILASKHWSASNFLTHTMDKLKTGAQYVFRIRYLNYLDWSPYSKPSAVMETVPTVPNMPNPPLIGGIFCDSVQLFWYFPATAHNGRPVTEYILRGRGSADTEYIECYRGPCTQHIVTGLFPQQCYSFELAAVNEVGASEYSGSVTALTLPKSKVKTEQVGFTNPAALSCADAWSERFDPHTQQYFYFNRITGTRQLEKPECMIRAEEERSRNESTSASGSAATAKSEEVAFRTKRYRFTLLVHKQKQPPSLPSSPQRQPQAPGSGPGGHRKQDAFTLELRREYALLDAFKCCHASSGQTNLQRRWKIVFAGEEGIDSGGLGMMHRSYLLFMMMMIVVCLLCVQEKKPLFSFQGKPRRMRCTRSGCGN